MVQMDLGVASEIQGELENDKIVIADGQQNDVVSFVENMAFSHDWNNHVSSQFILKHSFKNITKPWSCAMT